MVECFARLMANSVLFLDRDLVFICYLSFLGPATLAARICIISVYSPIYGCNVCLEMKYKVCSARAHHSVMLKGGPLLPSSPSRDLQLDDYHSPEEKPPGGMRFLLMTWPAPFSDGTTVLISAAPPDLYPSPVTGLPPFATL